MLQFLVKKLTDGGFGLSVAGYELSVVVMVVIVMRCRLRYPPLTPDKDTYPNASDLSLPHPAIHLTSGPSPALVELMGEGSDLRLLPFWEGQIQHYCNHTKGKHHELADLAGFWR